MSNNIWRAITSAALIALIVLCLAWELWLAPLRPGGSWLALKVLPLLIPLIGIVRGKRYTYRWITLLVVIYFVEGVVRAWSDKGLSAQLASIEIALTIIIFASAIAYVRGPKNIQ
ncbi:MAG: DUF2069 domain-containing protein [Betaproteobacteria bacterium]|nr:DUF2069 domain-containing protein [Betaproteobacteria bacterium]